eukprot:1137061-Pelagomonas_calceolata.AAC.8
MAPCLSHKLIMLPGFLWLLACVTDQSCSVEHFMAPCLSHWSIMLLTYFAGQGLRSSPLFMTCLVLARPESLTNALWGDWTISPKEKRVVRIKSKGAGSSKAKPLFVQLVLETVYKVGVQTVQPHAKLA